MPFNLSTVIQATAQWLVRAYPAPEGALHGALAEVQARQAATVAAWLRYPTKMDADLVSMVGPGGSGRAAGGPRGLRRAMPSGSFPRAAIGDP